MDHLLDEVLQKTAQEASRVPRSLAEQHGPLLLFNEDGTRPLQFWVFNSWIEAVVLGRVLGKDQPILAMTSMEGLVEDELTKRALLFPISERYLDLIQDWIEGEAAIIGGICQAGSIAEAMAHRMIGTLKRPPLLITLEHEIWFAYPGSVMMMYMTDDNEKHNPLIAKPSSRDTWLVKHDNPAWTQIVGHHGAHVDEPIKSHLCTYIRRVADQFSQNGSITSGEWDFPA